MNKSPTANDILVHDVQEPCPYLEGQVARMPLFMPRVKPTPEDVDRRWASGQRRTGLLVYVTRCHPCSACEPIRIPAADFRLNATQRRTLRRNDRLLQGAIGPLVVDPQRIDLFNQHRRARGLSHRRDAIDMDEYRWAFQESSFPSFELSYSMDGRLVALAITDQGRESLSAVYTFYDPSLSSLSLGTYCILKQLQYCIEYELTYLYLGFYIEQSSRMSYKSLFRPHQRLIDGRWVTFD